MPLAEPKESKESPSLNDACPICCKDDSKTMISLAKCSHKCCAACLVQWIEKVEATGQTSHPKCPFCRVEMTLDETQVILGRPFSPAKSTAAAAAALEVDDLTLQWLNERTKPCPRCGARIEKVEGGCDKMECLCGYRFCYGCGAEGARCGCSPVTHTFWDNVLGRRARRQTVVEEAPTDEETGTVNLSARIKLIKKIKIKQQRLLLLRHASKCPNEDGRCEVTPHCASMKRLWRHISDCRDYQCRVPHCISSKYVLSHYRRCRDTKCPICASVRETVRKSKKREEERQRMHEEQQRLRGQGGGKQQAAKQQHEPQLQVQQQQRQPPLTPVEFDHAIKVLKGLMTHEHGWVFNVPVDPVELGLPDYFQIIKRPMDLGTVLKRLEAGAFHSLEEFRTDVRLTFDNAMMYNEAGSVVHEMAKELTTKFTADYDKLLERLGRPTPSTTPAQQTQQRQHRQHQAAVAATEAAASAAPSIPAAQESGLTNAKDDAEMEHRSGAYSGGHQMKRIKLK